MVVQISVGENSITHDRSVSINFSLSGLVCSLGDLSAGGSATLSVVAKPSSVGTFTNQSNVFSNSIDSNQNNNSVVLNTPVLPVGAVSTVQFSQASYNVGKGDG